MQTYNKLIRDLIPAILDKKQQPYKIRIADEVEYREKLLEKLQEEATEVTKVTDHAGLLEELADVLEVIEAIKKHHNISTEDIAAVQLKKLEERGGFDQRIILEES